MITLQEREIEKAASLSVQMAAAVMGAAAVAAMPPMAMPPPPLSPTSMLPFFASSCGPHTGDGGGDGGVTSPTEIFDDVLGCGRSVYLVFGRIWWSLELQ